MARPSGVGLIVAALVQHLRATPTVTALVPAPRILDDVLEGTARPYLAVDVVSEVDEDVLSRGGVDATASITVASEYRGSAEIGRIASAVREALDGQALVVPDFEEPADVTYEQAVGTYRDVIAGVVVRHRPLWFRVRAV
jgi:hypothetical protein